MTYKESKRVVRLLKAMEEGRVTFDGRTRSFKYPEYRPEDKTFTWGEKLDWFPFEHFKIDGKQLDSEGRFVKEKLNKVIIPEVQEFCDKYGVYCAMDSDKKWWWYTEKPRVDNDVWTSRVYQMMPFQPNFDGDFRDTLHEPRGKECVAYYT